MVSRYPVSRLDRAQARARCSVHSVLAVSRATRRKAAGAGRAGVGGITGTVAELSALGGGRSPGGWPVTVAARRRELVDVCGRMLRVMRMVFFRHRIHDCGRDSGVPRGRRGADDPKSLARARSASTWRLRQTYCVPVRDVCPEVARICPEVAISASRGDYGLMLRQPSFFGVEGRQDGVGTDRPALPPPRTYVQLYLREEIKGEALVRNLPGFARFLPVAALFHGQHINVSGIARDAGVARSTVQGYLEILEDTLLARRLPAYEARLRVRERKHAKLYWVDPGIVRAVKRLRGPVAPEEAGALFEGWIHTLLRTYMAEREIAEDLAYWAPTEARRLEVDFLLRRGSELCALEVKSTRRFKPELVAGLRAVAELPGLRRRAVVYRGDRQLRTEDGIDVWPISAFLEALEGGTLWP